MVAPFAGAWIEILELKEEAVLQMSLPSRERGLKLNKSYHKKGVIMVAPFAGAWIEISASS